MMQKNIIHAIALKNVKQWIKEMCVSMDDDDNKQKINDMMEELLTMLKNDDVKSPYN